METSTAATPSPRPAWVWLAPVLIVLAGLIVYANSLHGPFLLDDHRAIEDNMSIRDWRSTAAVLHPPRQTPLTGRPLPNLSFAINYGLGGLAVEGYHAGNVLVHLLAALALFGVLRRSFARDLPGLPGSLAAGVPALMGALVWVVHPLNSDTVNYLTQRTESMMALFCLLALYAAIRGLDGKRLNRWELAAVVAAFCGVASKESALVIPFIVAAWDRTFAFPSWSAAWARRCPLYGLLTLSWLIFAFFARELPFFAPGGFEEQVSRWTYLLNQGPIITQYLGLTFWPLGLVFDYGAPEALSLTEAAPSLVIIAVLLAATGTAMVLRPALGFWGLWFFVTLAPASSLIPIPTEVGAERRMYLPLIGLIATVVLLVYQLAASRPGAFRRRAAVAGTAILVLALGASTMVRNRDYRTSLGMWQTVLDRRPHARAHEHLAVALRDAGDIEAAIAHLRLGAPDSGNARHALASALLEQGDLTGAIAEFREFVRLHQTSPRIVPAREEFALALQQAGDLGGAVEQHRAIVATAPSSTEGRLRLADALVEAGDHSNAITELREAVRLEPANLSALLNLGVLLTDDRPDEAVELLRRGLRLAPTTTEARKQLMGILFKQGRWAELELEAETLLSYAPDDAETHNLMGVALASQDRLGRAHEHFDASVRLDPTNAEARANLAAVNALVNSQP